MYSDGRFFESRPSGCTGQDFSSGTWIKDNDIITLSYCTDNPFNFEVTESNDTASSHQVVRIVDCYDQPVRFQHLYIGTSSENLYNPGMIRVAKGEDIYYAMPFENSLSSNKSVLSRADTLTFKWRCNRESIESINGGTLYISQEASSKKIRLRNRTFITLPE